MTAPNKIQHFISEHIFNFFCKRAKLIRTFLVIICLFYCRPEVNLNNILRPVLTHADPKSTKKDRPLDCIFCAFWICACKSCAKNVGKLPPKLNFINIPCTAIMHADPRSVERQSSFQSFLRFWDLQA